MFDKEYRFKGKHAEMVKRLVGNLDSKIGKGFFSTNADVYLVAPIIGFMYQRKAPEDKESNENTKIFTEKMLKIRKNCIFNYRLIMLEYEKNDCDIEERTRRAFKLDANDKERAKYDEIYEDFVRGGIEVLYEKIIGDGQTVEDFLENLTDFLEEYNNRYYKKEIEMEY